MENAAYGIQYVENLSYLGIFLAMMFSGYIIPLPEEIILLLAGYLSASGISNVYTVTLAATAGALMGDFIIYSLSYHGTVFAKKLRGSTKKKRFGWYTGLMQRHTGLVIFFSRFLVGLRIFNPLVSGFMRIKFRTFAIYSTLSALIYIPFIIYIGNHFASDINPLLRVILSIRHFVVFWGITFICLYLLLWVHKKVVDVETAFHKKGR